MILKEAHDRAADVAELERLLVEAPTSARSAIQKQISNIRAGAAGERSAAHFINREFGQSAKMALLHDLRIGVDGDFAQIDHLVIHRFQAAAWILETKNYSGRLSCDEHGDWTVWRNGKPQPIPSPVSQAHRQRRLLERWLKNEGITWIRHIHPVVLISPTSSVDRRHLSSEARVVKSDNFATWWIEQANQIGFGTALQMIGRHAISGMSQADFEELGGRLLAAHVPSRYDWKARFGLNDFAEGEPDLLTEANAEASLAVTDETRSEVSVPELIATPHGDVRISRIPDGRFAVRNDRNDVLIEIVKAACRGRGSWIARYRNWLISPEDIASVARAIEVVGCPAIDGRADAA